MKAIRTMKYWCSSDTVLQMLFSRFPKIPSPCAREGFFLVRQISPGWCLVGGGLRIEQIVKLFIRFRPLCLRHLQRAIQSGANTRFWRFFQGSDNQSFEFHWHIFWAENRSEKAQTGLQKGRSCDATNQRKWSKIEVGVNWLIISRERNNLHKTASFKKGSNMQI